MPVSAAVIRQLQGGVVTSEALRVVTKTAEAIVRSGRWSSSNGSRSWSHHDIEDLVGDFFADPGRIVDLAVAAGTDADASSRFQGALHTTLKRLLIDRMRQGPHGVLRRRVERHARARSDIVDVVPAHWALVSWKDMPHWDGGPEPLRAALATVTVDPPPAWSEDSPRAAPVTTTDTVTACCSCVLETAQSPVERRDVCDLVVERILPHNPSHVASPPVGEQQATTGTLDPADRMAARQAAEIVWRSLTPSEQSLLPVLETESRQLADQGFGGLGHSAINDRQRKFRDKMARLLADLPDGELVWDQLRIVAAGHRNGGEPFK